MRQDASTSDPLWDVSRLIELASSFCTLHPGDVFFTCKPLRISRMASILGGIGTSHVPTLEQFLKTRRIPGAR